MDAPLSSIQATLAERSLAHFVRKSWHVLEPQTPLVWGWHMQAVCDAVQALLEGRVEQNNLVINVPPGTGKSRIVSVCTPAWWWLQQPAYRFIFASGNPRVTTRDSLYCRNLITSKWYQNAFAPGWHFAADQNAKTMYSNSATGYRMAVTAGQAITGDRADALFWDDPIDAALANSKAERDSVIFWYDQAYANRLSDLRTGKRCGIAQRLHEGDLTGHVIASGEYAQLVIPQEYEPPKAGHARRVWANGWTDPREAEGELMDAVRFPPKVLAAERLRLGSAGYSGQHQQNPAAAEGEIFKRKFWRYYKSKQADAQGVPQPLAVNDLLKRLGITAVVCGGDTALSETKTADYTAFFALGLAPSRYYALDLWMQKVEAPEAKRQAALFAAKWNPIAFAIEGKGSASGKAIIQELARDTRIPTVEMPNIDKVVGANIVVPTVEAGLVYLPEDAAWVSDFVDSLAGFPRQVHDDDVDAFRLALSYAITGNPAQALMEYLRGSTQASNAAGKAAGAA